MRRLRPREGAAGPSPKGSEWQGCRAIPGYPRGQHAAGLTLKSGTFPSENMCKSNVGESPTMARVSCSSVIRTSRLWSLRWVIERLWSRVGERVDFFWLLTQSREKALATEHQRPGPWESPRDRHWGLTLTPSSLLETTGKGNKFSVICIPWPLFLPHLTFKNEGQLTQSLYPKIKWHEHMCCLGKKKKDFCVW